MDFKQWLENYREIDPNKEEKKASRLKVTWDLPLVTHPASADFSKLTRGFHLNTIISRMMDPWIAHLKRAPQKWRVSPTDKTANDNFKAAYEIFKQEIANAVADLPFKTGLNLATNKVEDVLSRTKEFFANYQTEEKNLIDSLNSAWKVHTSVFGNDPQSNRSQIVNFIEFLQIVKEQFMKIGEFLPDIGNESEAEQINDDFVKILDAEISKFKKIAGVNYK